MKFQEHGYIIHEKNIVFISVISMDISMNIFISAYPWGPLVSLSELERAEIKFALFARGRLRSNYISDCPY
jgi:hypothetical protein